LDTLSVVETLEGIPTVPPKNMDTVENITRFIGEYWILVSIGIFAVFSGLFMVMTGSYPDFMKKEQKKLDKEKKKD
jgi:hypothetical protein